MGIFLFCACENDMDEVRNLGLRTPGKEEAVKVVSYLSNDGIVKGKLTAPLMIRYLTDTPRIEFPNTLTVVFYGLNQVVESRLDARYGRYMDNESKILLQDSVMVINYVRGDTLNTDELWWDQNRQFFYTSKPVLVRQAGGQRIPAQHGMQADQGFKNITFNSVDGARLLVADSSMPR